MSRATIHALTLLPLLACAASAPPVTRPDTHITVDRVPLVAPPPPAPAVAPEVESEPLATEAVETSESLDVIGPTTDEIASIPAPEETAVPAVAVPEETPLALEEIPAVPEVPELAPQLEPVELAQAVVAPEPRVVRSSRPADTGTRPTPTQWVFEVDGQLLDFSQPLFAAEPGASIDVNLVGQTVPGDSGQGDVVGSSLRFEMRQDYTWEASGGTLGSLGAVNRLRWTLPATSGEHTLTVAGETAGSTTAGTAGSQSVLIEAEGERLTVQVLTPFDRNGPGVVGSYPVGLYPNEEGRSAPYPVQRRVDSYRPPTHFWCVTEGNRGAHLTRNVRLGDLCSVPLVNGTAYIAIAPVLLERLEAIHAGCVERGLLRAEDGGGLAVLRGYLSPTRLQQLQQAGAQISDFTRHIYGDAAIVIIDRDGDGLMDDLNGDGQVDQADAAVLGEIVEGTEVAFGRGGMGVFGGRPAGDPELPDTPMVQFDCRGERARW